MREDIANIRKAVKRGDIELMLIGNAVYMSDAKACQDVKIGYLKARSPVEISDMVGHPKGMVCSVCGHKLTPGDNYCPGCGLKVAVTSTG